MTLHCSYFNIWTATSVDHYDMKDLGSRCKTKEDYNLVNLAVIYEVFTLKHVHSYTHWHTDKRITTPQQSTYMYHPKHQITGNLNTEVYLITSNKDHLHIRDILMSDKTRHYMHVSNEDDSPTSNPNIHHNSSRSGNILSFHYLNISQSGWCRRDIWCWCYRFICRFRSPDFTE